MTQFYGIQPLDSLMIRGNRSFGAKGEHGESQMPPWPSLFAGAIRGAILGLKPEALAKFGREPLDEPLGEVLGTPKDPGSFRLAWSSLALKSSNNEWSPVFPLPADLSVDDNFEVQVIEPLALPAGVNAGNRLPMVPVLRKSKQSKPVTGRWMTGRSLELYIIGKVPQETLKTDSLFRKETRVGIGLNPGARTAEEGLIYSTEAISLSAKAGFLVGIDGLGKRHKDVLPEYGLLRLGGDGKAARYESTQYQSQIIPSETIKLHQQFRLVMTSPGIFTQGWLPNGVQAVEDEFRLRINGASARLVCAALGRNEVVSGWDIAEWKPKAAERVVPAGSVYWFDQLEGNACKLADWVGEGVWGDNPNKQRQAEGFNRAMLAAWPKKN